LSDFGLSKLVPEDDDSRSLFEQGEGCYLAPECEPSDQDFKPGLIGRSSDIWSLGCVLAEILAYLSGGPGGGPKMVAYFYEKRKIKLGPSICHHFHGINDINPGVANFLDRFSTQLAYEERFKSLACVVKASLQSEPDERLKASNISQRLFHLAQRHLLERACSALGDCLEPRNLELWIELQRLRIWGMHSGLQLTWNTCPIMIGGQSHVLRKSTRVSRTFYSDAK
jgi:serine/threonine protein kinase